MDFDQNNAPFGGSTPPPPQDNNNGYFSFNPPPVHSPNPEGLPKTPKLLAILSLIFSILGFCCCCCGIFGIALSLVGIILAVVDRVLRHRFQGLAIAGLVVGIIALIICVALTVLSTALEAELLAYLEESGYPVEEYYYYS